jgi:hypothetical protein
MDAVELARQFMRMHGKHLETLTEATMIVWFADAIMAGIETNQRDNREALK